MIKPQRRALGEQGFAALIIAIVLVVILSLITVGFAALMRNEQRSALDRQLSNSAYYAAESGINDASAAIRADYTKPKAKCDTSDVDTTMSGHQYLTNPNVDSSSNASYTCLLINPNPSTLEYSSVAVNEATTAVITGAQADGSDQAIDTLVFSWQDANGGKTFAANPPATIPSFPPVSQWVNGGNTITGILRVSLTPVGVALNRNNLEASTYTAFLYPQQSGGVTAIGSLPGNPYSASTTGNNAGVILNGKCNTGNTPRYCQVAISGLGQTTYLMQLSSIYYSTQVTITPFSGAAKIYIKGAQTLIDSTGKAQDVLRRVQVRLPARNAYTYPEFTLATGGNICKQLTTYPPNLATGTPGATFNACSPL